MIFRTCVVQAINRREEIKKVHNKEGLRNIWLIEVKFDSVTLFSMLPFTDFSRWEHKV